LGGDYQLTDITDIQADIKSIESNTSIYDEHNFDNRANAIDFIDFHILDRIESLRQSIQNSPRLDLLEQHAKELKQQLEDIDTCLFERLRQNIRAGIPFKNIIYKYIDPESICKQPCEPGYDNLDNFINSLLCFRPLPEASLDRSADMIFYQQTPARVIFQLAKMARLNPGDVFFDIGSGLGQVVILINLLTGAKTAGIEYEPAYCNYAKTSAAQLNLPAVEFLNIDARNVDYSSGTVFFLYTPFVGDMLQQMLDILQQQAEKGFIRIFTYGPCSTAIARKPWLKCINGDGDDSYKLY